MTRVVKKALMAALIGSSCGAAAGYWTPPGRAAIKAPAAVDGPGARAGGVPADVSLPARTSRPGVIDVELGDAVRRAKELAQRPDVSALVSLREAMLSRAEVAGRKNDPATMREIEAIDRYLFEARALRLRLDAAAIRKGT